MNIECNADLGHECDGDNGCPCALCAENARYWVRLFRSTPRSVIALDIISPSDLEQQLREAGRWPHER